MFTHDLLELRKKRQQYRLFRDGLMNEFCEMSEESSNDAVDTFANSVNIAAHDKDTVRDETCRDLASNETVSVNVNIDQYQWIGLDQCKQQYPGHCFLKDTESQTITTSDSSMAEWQIQAQFSEVSSSPIISTSDENKPMVSISDGHISHIAKSMLAMIGKNDSTFIE